MVWADEVKVPEKPVSAELPYVTVICTSNASHSVLERNYYILDEEIDEGRVIVGDVKYDSTNGNYVSHVRQWAHIMQAFLISAKAEII